MAKDNFVPLSEARKRIQSKPRYVIRKKKGRS